jgi:hemerythrin-like domain-containing protein
MTTTPIDPPINQFLNCHAGIVSRLRDLGELPRLAEQANRARDVATQLLQLFEGPVLEHHQDEEKELFPAVVRSATPGEERARVEHMVRRLEQEHRVVEQLWKELEPAVRAAAKGKEAHVDMAKAGALVEAYLTHANFEETFLLPLAEQILGRNGNHMAALGLSLHLRHAPQPVGYI